MKVERVCLERVLLIKRMHLIIPIRIIRGIRMVLSITKFYLHKPTKKDWCFKTTIRHLIIHKKISEEPTLTRPVKQTDWASKFLRVPHRRSPIITHLRKNRVILRTPIYSHQSLSRIIQVNLSGEKEYLEKITLFSKKASIILEKKFSIIFKLLLWGKLW